MLQQTMARAVRPHDPSASIVMGDTSSLINTIRIWRKQRPLVTAVIEASARALKLDARQKAIIDEAALLAAEPNDNAFHKNRHFLEVFAVSALLGWRAHKEGRLSKDGLTLLLTAALIHDYKHDGTTNGTTQYKLESIAYEAAAPRLAVAGATPDDLAKIKAFVLTTDVSRDFSKPDSISPADSVKKYLKSGNENDLAQPLRPLHGWGLADTAMMLHDADLSGSLLSPDLNKQAGDYLAAEQGRTHDAKSDAFFIEHICHHRMFSKAGHDMLQPHMEKTMRALGVTLKPLMD